MTANTTTTKIFRTRRLAALLLAAGIASSAHAKDIFVDVNVAVSGDGSSWDKAFRHLQDGLRAAETGDTVKIADGVYYPDRDIATPEGSGDRGAFFSIPAGVDVKGSFAGFGAADPDARATTAPKTTVLCGDLNEDDLPGFGNRRDNSYHVVGVIDSPGSLIATLDGVRVSGGHADGPGISDRVGGGITLIDGRLITNCVEVTDNFAADCGGGVYIGVGSRMLTRDTRLGDNRSADIGGGAYVEPLGEIQLDLSCIEDNQALEAGGIYNAGTMILFTGTEIVGNSADGDGGGVLNEGGSITASGTLFKDNSAANGDSGSGGGLHTRGGEVDLDNVTFSNNKTIAPFNGGGGLAAFDDATVTISGGLFDGNCAGFGGGIWVFGLNDAGGSVSVDGTGFTGNIADLNGGAVDLFNSPATFNDTTWTNNVAVGNPGGAIQATVNSGVTITDSVATGNRAPNGAAFNFESGSSATLDNVDVLNNTAGVVNALQGNGTVAFTIRDCTFDGNANGGIGIQDSLTVDIEGSTISNTTGQPGVFLIAGLGDEAGLAWRVEGTTVADNATAGIILVNASAFGVDATIIDSTITGNSSPVSGGGLQATDLNPAGDSTLTISGTEFSGNTSQGDGGGTSVRGYTKFCATADIWGFGSAEGNGGGLYIEDTTTVDLSGCTFDGNTANGEGGAFYFEGFESGDTTAWSTVKARNNQATNSSGTGPGSTAVVTSSDEGAAAGLFTLASCEIIGGPGTNTRGLRADGVNISMINSEVSAHTLTDGDAAGLMLTGGDRHEIINSTIAGNSTTGSTGGVLVTDTELAIAGSILFANTDVFGGQEAQVQSGGTATITADRSIVEGISSLPGTGSIGSDPLFLDVLGPDGVAFTGDEDLTLSAGSPAIDAGDNTALPSDLLLDLAGNARFFDDPGTPDTGVPGGAGGALVVDMGAYEYADAPSCYADCDGNGTLDWFDFLCFQNAFDSGDAAADCDGDGRFTVFDFLCFQNAFATGCP